MGFYKIPKIFTGRTVAVIGTGPSLTHNQIDTVFRANIPAIVVNNAYEFAPWAEWLHGCDRKWWDEYAEKGKLGGPGPVSFTGIKTTLEDPVDATVYRIGYDPKDPRGFDDRLDYIRGNHNGGAQAAEIAVKAGAAGLILLGMDCRKEKNGPSHCFGGHYWWQSQGRVSNYRIFIEGWNALSVELKKRGISVINCSKNSALECFEKADLESLVYG